MYSITINYNLPEYVSLILKVSRQFYSKETINAWYFKILAYPVITIMFYFKKLTVGNCRFKFSSEGFERNSSSDFISIEWSKIEKVVTLESFYLVVVEEDHILPLPKRCFTSSQKLTLESWLGNKLANEL